MPTLMSKIITALTDISARLVLSRWQWSCNWELWTDLSRCRLLQCWGAMLQIMQLQSGPGPLPVRHTGKYSGAFSDSWCCRLWWNIHPATHARCHLRGALQPRAPSLSLFSPGAIFWSFLSPASPGIVITQINTGLAGSLTCADYTTLLLAPSRAGKVRNKCVKTAAREIRWWLDKQTVSDDMTISTALRNNRTNPSLLRWQKESIKIPRTLRHQF